MLDIKFIRENKELIALGAKKKHIDFDVDKLVKIDDKRRELIASIEKKRAEQNQVSTEVVKATGPEREKLIASMKALKVDMEKESEDLKDIMKRWQSLMLAVPNIPDMSVPDGKDESENKEVKVWGEKPQFGFQPKDHVELMTSLGMVDFERGTKVHGFRGYFLKGAGADLTWAIWNYARDFFGARGFNPFIAPSIVKKEFFYGTGH